MTTSAKIEVSNGELADKVAILQIKLTRMSSSVKLKNVRKEFKLLQSIMVKIGISEQSEEYLELVKVNNSLWDIEDAIRRKEAKQEFDKEFIALARSVYFENDKRAGIKRRINLKTKSGLIEEKQYVKYK